MYKLTMWLVVLLCVIAGAVLAKATGLEGLLFTIPIALCITIFYRIYEKKLYLRYIKTHFTKVVQISRIVSAVLDGLFIAFVSQVLAAFWLFYMQIHGLLWQWPLLVGLMFFTLVGIVLLPFIKQEIETLIKE